MSIGLGIFASVVLILAVYHTGFRRVLLWSGAILAVLALLCAVAYFGYERYTTWEKARAEAQATFKDEAAKRQGIVSCMSRLGTPWTAGTPDFIPAAYFSNLQACTIAPDNYAPSGADIFDRLALQHPLPKDYTFDGSNRVIVAIDFSQYAVPPCADNTPLGFVADQPCILSGVEVKGFRREMCLGAIQANGDCVENVKPLKGFADTLTQLCPYGLPIGQDRKCPPWDNVDVEKARHKLLAYRRQKR